MTIGFVLFPFGFVCCFSHVGKKFLKPTVEQHKTKHGGGIFMPYIGNDVLGHLTPTQTYTANSRKANGEAAMGNGFRGHLNPIQTHTANLLKVYGEETAEGNGLLGHLTYTPDSLEVYGEVVVGNGLLGHSQPLRDSKSLFRQGVVHEVTRRGGLPDSWRRRCRSSSSISGLGSLHLGCQEPKGGRVHKRSSTT